MIEVSKEMLDEILENGFNNLTADWTVELRQGTEILVIVPVDGTFKFERTGNRLQINRSYESIVLKSGDIDNFILRNKVIPDYWLKADAGLWGEEVKMKFDTTIVTKGNPIWLDTFTFWY